MDVVVIINLEPTMTTQTTALDAYRARAAAIHIKLTRLQQLADTLSFTRRKFHLLRGTVKFPG